MHVGRSATPLALSLLPMLMLAAGATESLAQSHDAHAAGTVAQPHKRTAQENEAVTAVRDATARFKDVTSIDRSDAEEHERDEVVRAVRDDRRPE